MNIMENQNTQNENQNNPQDNSQSQESTQQGNSQGDTPLQNQNADQSQQQQTQGNAGSSADTGKLWGVLGYIIPVLFFIPLVMDDLKNNPYSKFHANQQVVLLISWIIVNVVGTLIPVLGWFIILPIGSLILFVLAIIGLINAAKGEQKPLPIVGGFTLIK